MAEVAGNTSKSFLDLGSFVGDLNVDDETASDDISLEGLEEELQECQTDDVVANILSKGATLREHTKGVENNLRQVELDSIQDYIKESDNLVSLHDQIRDCDMILSGMETLLSGFQEEIGSISSDIKILQEQSMDMGLRLKNRKVAESKLAKFVEDIIVPPRMIEIIVDGEVNEEYMRTLEILSKKLKCADADPTVKTSKALKDVQPELEKLRQKAVSKVFDFMVQKLYALRKPKTNIQILQQSVLLKYKYILSFLKEHSKEVYLEVRAAYIDTMNKVLSAQFRAYIQALEKLQLDIATSSDLIGVETRSTGLFSRGREPLKNRSAVFALGERINILKEIDEPPLIPHIAEASSKKYPYEVLFRSLHKLLMDTASSEYLFCDDFFGEQTMFYDIFTGPLSVIDEHFGTVLPNSFDAIGLMLMIRIIHQHQLVMSRRRIPCLDSYLDKSKSLEIQLLQLPTSFTIFHISMASLTNSILTFQTSTPHQHEGTTLRPDALLSSSYFPIQRVKLSTRTPSLSSKTSQSLTSIISELEKERDNTTIDQFEEGESTSTSSTTMTKIQEPELADRWQDIHGQDDWVGMLDPMDPLLRTELIRYGEMAQACYDAFDFDPYSKYCGSCKFPRHRFFDGLDMANYGYDITRYLYATSNINLPNFFMQARWPKVWSKNANWIGYVAVSNDETSKRLGRRDITIAWRGTVTRLEWIADLMDYLRPISADNIPCPDPYVKVESGFLELYIDKDENCRYCKFSAREQILTEVKRLLEMYPNEEMSITVTGHSLGSALAMLSAYDIVETGLNVRADTSAVPICVFSFSGPRVGNIRFKERIEELGVKVLRVVNVHDIVPKSPGLVFNEHSPAMVMKICEGLPWSYSHVGVELALDHKNSPFLKPINDPVCAHNLEAHLHLLDGYHGKGRRFVLTTGRDIALVNKACDFLKDHYCVPPSWRQDENKGMIRDKDGRWIQPERPRLDDHPSDIHLHLQHLGLSSS